MMYILKKDIRDREVRYVMPVMIVFIIFAGCSPSWVPSDEAAVRLVENYYLFNYGGEQVEAEVVKRGKYTSTCNCIPIKFKIDFSQRQDNNKTFYFYKNGSGQLSVRMFMFVK